MGIFVYDYNSCCFAGDILDPLRIKNLDL